MDCYKKSLNENSKNYIKSNKIASIKQQVFTLTQNKLGLSSFDNKRYWLDNESSVPFGHYSLTNNSSCLK